MDFSGGYHSLTADVKGLEMGGASAQRNFARVIQQLLSNTTWGLGEIADKSYFNAAATATAVISEPPLPKVVISPSLPTPWNPVTITTLPAFQSFTMRLVWILSMRARP